MQKFGARVRFASERLTIEVGEWDENRWGDGEGGFRFGFTADVSARQDIFAADPGAIKVEASQGSTGYAPPAEARTRALIYLAAATLAAFVETKLAEDVALDQIGRYVAAIFTDNVSGSPVLLGVTGFMQTVETGL